MNPTRFRRTTTGTCLVLWPITMLGAALAQPKLGEDPAEVYDAASAHAGRIAASVAIGTPGVLLWIVAVVGAVHLVRSRGATLAHVGGLLALLGAVGHAMMATLFLVLLGLPDEGDRATLVPVLDGIAGHVFPVVMPLLVLGGLGVVLLAVALRRAGRVPLACPLLVGAGFLSEFVPLGGTLADVVLWVLVGAGLATAGLAVLDLPDEQWDAPAGTPSSVPAASGG